MATAGSGRPASFCCRLNHRKCGRIALSSCSRVEDFHPAFVLEKDVETHRFSRVPFGFKDEVLEQGAQLFIDIAQLPDFQSIPADFRHGPRGEVRLKQSARFGHGTKLVKFEFCVHTWIYTRTSEKGTKL